MSAAPERVGPLPGARLALALLIVVNLFNYIDRQVLSAVLPELKKDYFPNEAAAEQEEPETKTTKLKLGLLQTAFMVSYMLTAPLFGLLAERYSRWKLIAVGVILWSLASGASGLAATFVVMFLTRCFVGIGEAAYGPAAPTIIADLYPVQMRGKVISWFYVAIPVGSALGYVLGETMLKLMGHRSWAFYVVVPPGILLGLLCFCMSEPPRGLTDGDQPAEKATARDYWTLLYTPSYVLDTLGMTALTFALGGIAFWMPYYIIVEKGYDQNTNTVFGGIVVVSGLLATLLGGMAGDALRTRVRGSYFVVSGAAMFLGFVFFILLLNAEFPTAWIYVFLSCFCLFFNTGPTNTILANVVHPSMRATGFAINILVIHLFGDAVSPFLIGAISDRYSMKVAFQVVSALVLVGGIFWLWGATFLERDTELAPQRLAPRA